MKLILFDIDGTLLDCGRQVKSFFADAMTETFGTSGEIDRYDFAGKTDHQISFDLLQDAGVGAESIAAGLPRMKERYFGTLDRGLDRESMRLLPGVLDTLEALARRPGVALGLLTGNWERGARIKLGRFDLNRFFPFGAFGDGAAERKALPPRALETAERVHRRRFQAADTVIVGDTKHDVDCARAHGAGSIGVTTGRYTEAELRQAGADRVVAGLEELL